MSLEAVASTVGRWQSEGQKVVLTNGVFDILHVGHVAVLETAAAQGDKLVVAVNATRASSAWERETPAPTIIKRTGPRCWPPFAAWTQSFCSAKTPP